MKNVNVSSWAAWKSLVLAKGMLPQYIESSDRYDLFAIEANISWEFNILKDGGADVTEFEVSYKSTYNKPLEVKAGPGRPTRVAASPQPINTVQRWKGYKLTLPTGQTSAYLDISFGVLIYLKGGIIVPDGEADGSCRLSLDVLYGANDMVILPGILDGCYIMSDQPVNFVSPEAMAVAPELKIRLTISTESPLEEDRTVFITAEYFK